MKKTVLFLLLTLMLPILPLRAEETEETDAAPNRQRPKVGLVLSGGGAKGMAHIGAMKVIEELGIPIDYVVGTSIGSIVGGIYALGYNAEELDSLVRSQDWNLLMLDQMKRQGISYENKEDQDRYFLSVPFLNYRSPGSESVEDFNNRWLLRNMPDALVTGQNLDQLFTKLSVGYQDDIDFNTLPIPFACVAVDLNTKEEVVFHSGDIVTAMRSSMSIPGYFAPVKIGSQYLVDGGLLNNMPVDVARKMGADYIICIDLHHFKEAHTDTEQTIPEMIGSMLNIMNGEKYQSGRAASDIIIEPDCSRFDMLAFDDKSVNALVDSGYVAAQRVLPQLRSLAGHLQEFDGPEAPRPPHAIDLNRQEVLISQLEIDGADAADMNWALAKTGIAPGKKISGETMDKAMNFIYDTRCFSKASYDIAGNEKEGYRLKIHLEPQRVHEANLGFRFDSEEMASILLGVSFNKHKLFGSKINLEGKLGANPFVWLDYSYTFHNLTKLILSIEWDYMNIDTYDRIEKDGSSQYNMLGTDRFNIFNARAAWEITGWRISSIRFGVLYDNYACQKINANETGINPGTKFTDHNLGGFVQWKFDNLDDSYFPKRGLKFNLSGNVYRNYDWSYVPTLDLKAAIPLGSRFTLIPQTFNRWIMGSNPTRYYLNYVGGMVGGRYVDTQMPFAGINHTYIARRKVDIARLDAQINLFRQHYLTLTGDYLFEWDEFSHHGWLGLAAAYGINTRIGPVQFVSHWSTLSRRPGFYFSLGYNF